MKLELSDCYRFEVHTHRGGTEAAKLASYPRCDSNSQSSASESDERTAHIDRQTDEFVLSYRAHRRECATISSVSLSIIAIVGQISVSVSVSVSLSNLLKREQYEVRAVRLPQI